MVVCNSFSSAPTAGNSIPIRIDIDATAETAANAAASNIVHIRTTSPHTNTTTATPSTAVDPFTACFLLLEVPVRAEIDIIDGQGNVHIERLYSDHVHVRTSGDIHTHNLNGYRFDLESTCGGSVHCTGNTLAHRIDVRVRQRGDVYLAKVQGDRLSVTGDSGTIRTSACYSESSAFVSLDGGRLCLDNVHKVSDMRLAAGGRVHVTGFHGQLCAKLSGECDGRFQLTELYGDSCIEAIDGGGDEGSSLGSGSGETTTSLMVNVSDFVLANNALDVLAERADAKVLLDDNLADGEAERAQLLECLSADGSTFRRSNPSDGGLGGADLGEDRLTVRSTVGDVRLGRLSWTDTVKMKLNVV